MECRLGVCGHAILNQMVYSQRLESRLACALAHPSSPNGFSSLPPLLPFLSHNHHRRTPILPQTQMRPTRQTVPILRHGTEDAQANAAHEADVDDVAVAEARCAEVD